MEKEDNLHVPMQLQPEDYILESDTDITTIEIEPACQIVECDVPDNRPISPFVVSEQELDASTESGAFDENAIGTLPIAHNGSKRKRCGLVSLSECGRQSSYVDGGNVIDLLLNSSTNLSTIPDKQSGERIFIVTDAKNKRRSRRRKETFDVDDKKGWSGVSLTKHYFLCCDGVFRSIQATNGTYYFSTSSRKQNSEGEKLSNHPTTDEILILVVINETINSQNLNRRISFIEKLPKDVTPTQDNLLVVEYQYTKSSSISIQPAVKLPKLDSSMESAKAAYREDGFAATTSGRIKGTRAKAKKSGTGLSGNFLEKNQLIKHLVTAETTLEEVPLGKKENEFFLVNYDENYRREAGGKRRVYIDDCGVWKNISVKRCWFIKIDGQYENVKYVDGSYKIMNAAIRSNCSAPNKSDILAMRWVYANLRRCEHFKRRISWIDSFPRGITPRQQHVAVFEYIGKYPGINNEPHGNQRKPDIGPYVRTSSKDMKKMREQLAFKTVREVIADNPGLQPTKQTMKKLENLRYRNSFRIGPGSAKNSDNIDAMKELVSLVHTHPFVQHVSFNKGISPFAFGYTTEHINAWKFRSSKDSGLQRVMGVDRTMNFGPIHVTTLTYPHPNLLCRHSGLAAVFMGPTMVHVDRSKYIYSCFFNHVKDRLDFHETRTFDGITIALGSRDEQALLEAVESCFPSSKLGYCVEHMETELKTFLATDIGWRASKVNHITQEIFSKLMPSIDEDDFDLTLGNLQSMYNATNHKLGKFFEKFGEDLKLKYWKPLTEGMSLMKWSLETCPALQCVASSLASLESISEASALVAIQRAATDQTKDEVSAIYDCGPYMLAPHVTKYAHTEANWTDKTTRQKARVIEKLRKHIPVFGKDHIGSMQHFKSSDLDRLIGGIL